MNSPPPQDRDLKLDRSPTLSPSSSPSDVADPSPSPAPAVAPVPPPPPPPPSSPSPSRLVLLSLLLICLVLALSEAARGVVIPTLSSYLSDSLQAPAFALPMAVALFSVGRLIASLYYGWAIERSRKRIKKQEEEEEKVKRERNGEAVQSVSASSAASSSAGFSSSFAIPFALDCLSSLQSSLLVVLCGHFLYILAASSSSGFCLFLLLFARCLLGFGTGILTVARSYVATLLPSEMQIKYMSVLSAVQFVGFAFTPLLGGISGVKFGLINQYTFGTFLVMLATIIMTAGLFKVRMGMEADYKRGPGEQQQPQEGEAKEVVDVKQSHEIARAEELQKEEEKQIQEAIEMAASAHNEIQNRLLLDPTTQQDQPQQQQQQDDSNYIQMEEKEDEKEETKAKQEEENVEIEEDEEEEKKENQEPEIQTVGIAASHARTSLLSPSRSALSPSRSPSSPLRSSLSPSRPRPSLSSPPAPSRIFPHHLDLWSLVVLNGLNRGCLSLVEAYGTSLYTSVHSTDEDANEDASEFFFELGCIGFVLLLVVDHVSTRFGKNRTLWFGLLLNVLGFFSLCEWDEPAPGTFDLSMGMMLIWSISNPLCQTLLVTSLSTRCRSQSLSPTPFMAYCTAAGSLGRIFFPLVGGAIFAVRESLADVFLFGGCMALIGICIIPWLEWERFVKETKAWWKWAKQGWDGRKVRMMRGRRRGSSIARREKIQAGEDPEAKKQLDALQAPLALDDNLSRNL